MAKHKKQRLVSVYSHFRLRQTLLLSLCVIISAFIGLYYLTGSHAATPYASITADSGTLTSGATKQTCQGASDGNCVVFNGAGSGTLQANCFATPGNCGYPDPTVGSDIVGANTCSDPVTTIATIHANNPSTTYIGAGSLEITGSNVSLANMNLGSENIYVAASVNNFTLKNVCMAVNGGGLEGAIPIGIASGDSGTVIENSTISGINNTTESIGRPVQDYGTDTTIANNYFYNMGDGTLDTGNGSTVTNNYELINTVTLGTPQDTNEATGNTTNGSNVITGLSSTASMTIGDAITGPNIPPDYPGAFIESIDSSTQIEIGNGSGHPVDATATATGSTFTYGTPEYSHDEDVYCSDNTLTITHNTLLNNQEQTATIFCNSNGGSGNDNACDNKLTIKDNFLAGGGYLLYPCAHSSTAGTSSMNIEDNRFARCLGTPITSQYPNGGGGHTCGATDDAGADSHGYWPYGGYFGTITANFTGPSEIWSGNYWDDSPSQTVCVDGSFGCP